MSEADHMSIHDMLRAFREEVIESLKASHEAIKTNEAMDARIRKLEAALEEARTREASAGARQRAADGTGSVPHGPTGERTNGVPITLRGIIPHLHEERENKSAQNWHVTPEEYRCLKATVPTFNGSHESFPLFRGRFEDFLRQIGCWAAFQTERNIKVGSRKFSEEAAMGEGASVDEIRTARMAWACLVESVSNVKYLPTRLLRLESPREAMTYLMSLYLSDGFDGDFSWRSKFSDFAMEEGEEPLSISPVWTRLSQYWRTWVSRRRKGK